MKMYKQNRIKQNFWRYDNKIIRRWHIFSLETIVLEIDKLDMKIMQMEHYLFICLYIHIGMGLQYGSSFSRNNKPNIFLFISQYSKFITTRDCSTNQ